MAYVSLYRKYRPRTFDEVVGQAHVIRTLVNAIEEDRLHHAYLFTGPRGTGKTSTARLLAKAINCERGPTPTPCDACVQCEAISAGSSVDVIELDMASHGGVEDARELRDRALFAPAAARRKIYILDEVHMASTAAFNALLKLIEEPPPHVLFAMATTDPQKVLPTIMSRVQRLDLRRVSAADVAGNVRRICEAEGYTIEDDAVEAIVRAGDGSVRDTQSILEQVLAFAGSEVTAQAVAQVLGTTPADRVVETVDRLAERDLAGLFAVVQGLLDEGHDLRRFTLDLVQHLRDLLVLQVAPERPDLVDATDERRRRLQAQGSLLPQATLLRAVDELAGCLVEQRQGPPRLPLELTLARLAVPGADSDLAELADRVGRLEAEGPADRRGSTGTPSAGGGPVEVDVEVATSAPAGEGSTVDRSSSSPATSGAAGEGSAVDGSPSSPATSPATATSTREHQPVAPSSSADSVADLEPPPGAGGAAEPARGSEPSDVSAPGERGSAASRARARAAAAKASSAPTSEPSAVPPGSSAPAAGSPTSAGDADAASADEPSVPRDEDALPAGEPSSAGDADTAPAGEPSSAGDADAASADGSPEDGDAAASGSDPDADLQRLLQHWPAILELIKQRSRRSHALFEPATPISLRRRILTLRYARRYASFHAANATKGEFVEVVTQAIRQACDLDVRIDVVIEGQDERRRPLPASVTPDDARTPADEDWSVDAAAASQEAEVREAELGGEAVADDATVEQLLATELGAELVDEQPPRERGRG